MPTAGPTTSQKVVNHYQKKGRLDLLTNLYAVLGLKDEDQRQARSREAESQWANRQLWGAQPPKEGDEMGDNIYLGDVTVTQPESKPSTLATLVRYGLAIGGGGLLAVAAPAAIDWLSRDTSDPQPPIRTEITNDYEIGEITIE